MIRKQLMCMQITDINIQKHSLKTNVLHTQILQITKGSLMGITLSYGHKYSVSIYVNYKII